MRGERFVHIADAADDDGYRLGNPVRRALVDLAGARSYLAVPIRRDDVMLGSFTIYRREVRPFSPELIALLQSFAAQAAIAIENARLFNETQEALAHQTATSEVLQAIGSSMADTQPVFERILDSVEQLFDIRQCSVVLAREGMLHLVARRGTGDAERVDRLFPAPLAQSKARDVIGSGRQVYVSSAANAEESPLSRRVAEAMGDHSLVMTPMVWEGQSVGMISVARAPNAVFSEKELALLRTFADQAVIAIENVRLFNETKEALERQTATADVLKVIASSPSEVQPVFQAIADRANRLINGHAGTVFRIVGDTIELAAFTPVSAEADAVLRASFPMPITGRLVFEKMYRGEIVEITDTESDAYSHLVTRHIARARGFRSRIMVPLRSATGTIGAISVTRKKPGAFARGDIDLLLTFADQAVIAIQNARLFNETKEALEHQTATAEVLSVISSSMADPKPVFERIVDSIERLFQCKQIGIFLTPGDGLLHLAAGRGANMEFVSTVYPLPVEQTAAPSVLGARQQVYYADCLNGADVPESLHRAAELIGNFSDLLTPMMWEDRGVGMMTITREPNVDFSDKERALLKTFADQAVVAIENARLFNEVQSRTRDLSEALEQQTATSEVLEVISSSPGELQPVFNKMLENATRVCGANFGIMNRGTASFSEALPPTMSRLRSRPCV